LGAQFNLGAFHFNTRNAFSRTELDVGEGFGNVEAMGVFYEWNLGLKLQGCF
jgi:hypothetical protein